MTHPDKILMSWQLRSEDRAKQKSYLSKQLIFYMKAHDYKRSFLSFIHILDRIMAWILLFLLIIYSFCDSSPQLSSNVAFTMNFSLSLLKFVLTRFYRYLSKWASFSSFINYADDTALVTPIIQARIFVDKWSLT